VCVVHSVCGGVCGGVFFVVALGLWRRLNGSAPGHLGCSAVSGAVVSYPSGSLFRIHTGLWVCLGGSGLAFFETRFPPGWRSGGLSGAVGRRRFHHVHLPCLGMVLVVGVSAIPLRLSRASSHQRGVALPIFFPWGVSCFRRQDL